MDYITLIGIIAATCTSSTFLPQVIKSYRSKSTKELSLGMMLLMLFGVSLWVIYGVIKKDVAILYAQTVAFFFTSLLLVLKIKYK
jgi:MtN3 and saliva related transmembrane protein